MPAGSAHESRHLPVRDFLRAHRAEAMGYEALKRQLVECFPQDRLAYIAGKERHLSDLQTLAVEWAQSSLSAPS